MTDVPPPPQKDGLNTEQVFEAQPPALMSVRYIRYSAQRHGAIGCSIGGFNLGIHSWGPHFHLNRAV